MCRPGMFEEMMKPAEAERSCSRRCRLSESCESLLHAGTKKLSQTQPGWSASRTNQKNHTGQSRLRFLGRIGRIRCRTRLGSKSSLYQKGRPAIRCWREEPKQTLRAGQDSCNPNCSRELRCWLFHRN